MSDQAVSETQSNSSWRMPYGEYFYLPPKFEFLLREPKWVKVFYGGRGAAKTKTFARCIVYLMHTRYPINGHAFRVLCGREYQNSIAESVWYEIKEAIEIMGLVPWFKLTGSSIRHRSTHAQCLFRGLHSNIDQIKSLGGIDLFWGEEAHGLTNDSLIYIEPTIRVDPPHGPCGNGSELWFSLNQNLDTDPIYVRYKLAQGAWEDEMYLVVPVTYKDNPFFPTVLERQRAAAELALPKDEYEWIWGTQCRNLGGIFFAESNLMVNGKPIAWPTICDTVFAVMDTAVKTGNDRDGTAVLYCAFNQTGAGHPLVWLDYDYIQIQGNMLEAWMPLVYQNCMEMAKQCKARFGFSGIWIEDKASGMILLQQAQKHEEWRAQAIDSKLTAMGKTERAISVSGYVHRGMAKVSQQCYDRVITYKGVTLNHLMSQIKAFRVGDEDAKERADDLLDCATYSLAITLGNMEGF